MATGIILPSGKYEILNNPAGTQQLFTGVRTNALLLFSILSDDRSKASSKTIPPHSTIQSLLLQMRVSSPVLKVIQ